ncbi:hypothetical protein ACWIGW_44460 [Nocardia brasiliensis]
MSPGKSSNLTHDHSWCSIADPDVIAEAQLHRLHDFLTARGWRVDSWHDSDPETGYPLDAEAGWTYPASYGGVAMNDVDDVTPKPLSCDFFLDSNEYPDETASWSLGLRVSSAGNWGGCPQHGLDVHESAVPEDCADIGLEQLAALLDRLEPQAGDLDPRALIECRFFGPCGQE